MDKELVIPVDQMKQFLETREKPPIGLMPREIHDAIRIQEIEDAMIRYIKAGKEIPMAWVKEYNELIQRRKETDHG